MSLFELLLRPDLRTSEDAFKNCRRAAFDNSTLPPTVQQPQMNQGQWMLDSRSLGIGIAIGILVTVILASFIGLLSVSLRRKPYRTSRSQLRSRTTLPLTFSIPTNLTSSKNRHVPTATERLSLDSRRKAAVATPPPRSPSPEFVLDIAPRKARETSPPSPSSQVDPQALSELDLEEMRAMNTFSGLPTATNAERASTSRPTSAHLSGAIFDIRSTTSTPQHNPSSSSGSRRALTARHKRVSELELQEGPNSPWAQTAVRRVQSAGYLGDHTPRTEQQSQAQLYARKWEQEHAAEGSRTPRGMGHTLPKPQTAKTVPSRPGTGTGTGNGTGPTERNTPFSSSSSLGLPFGTNSGTSAFDNFSPTTAGTGTENTSFSYPPSQITEKDYKRRRRREKDHETYSHGSTAEPSHSRGESITTLSPLDQDADIAPPPYNVANVHSSSHDSDPSSHQLSDPDSHKRWHLQMQRERIRAQIEAQAQEQMQEPNPEEEEQERVRNRSRSDSRSSEMGFGVSHHARNHLL